MKTEFFGGGKVKLEKCSVESEKFSEIGGNLKQGIKCIIASGGWMPLLGAGVSPVQSEAIFCP